eukprot:TRINITY_DN3760_c0_g1_i1.p1 TRINITY_DN3760_c0_g1~~TRINITY_DN3760_c0_g1_i1.p1  ORF type:complete len:491 (-),score=136.25 TRINITY_DN3760_c0_g1_i1:96-1568(-)
MDEGVLVGFGCGHEEFCLSCLFDFLRVNIASANVTRLTCPKSDCTYALKEQEILQLLEDDPALRARFVKFSHIAAIKADPLRALCPSTDCSGTLKKKFSEEGQPLPCSCTLCGSEYCSGCICSLHPGQTCDERRKERLAAFIADNELSGDNLRPCPRCGTPAIKDGGCNHMTCRSCGENWCWICGAFGVSVANYSHYYTPGRCFGVSEEEGESVFTTLFLTGILLPISATFKVVDGVRAHKLKKERRKRGETYTVAVVGARGVGKSTFIHTYSKSDSLSYLSWLRGTPAPARSAGDAKTRPASSTAASSAAASSSSASSTAASDVDAAADNGGDDDFALTSVLEGIAPPYETEVTHRVGGVPCEVKLAEAHAIGRGEAMQSNVGALDPHAAVVVFSLMDGDSFSDALELVVLLRRSLPKTNVPVLLVGTHSEQGHRRVRKSEVKRAAKKMGLVACCFVNAYDGWNVRSAMKALVAAMLQRWEEVQKSAFD